jgi:hypothetical protein
MGDHKEQRVCVKFCFLLEKTAAETIVMLQQAFVDDAFGKSQVYEWFSSFKNGNMSIEELPRPGRPLTSRNEEKVEKVRQAINEDRRKTIEQVSEETNVMEFLPANFNRRFANEAGVHQIRATWLSLSDSSWRRATWSFCPTHPTRLT